MEWVKLWLQIDGLVQERRNSSALAMELRLSCTNSSKWSEMYIKQQSQILYENHIIHRYGNAEFTMEHLCNEDLECIDRIHSTSGLSFNSSMLSDALIYIGGLPMCVLSYIFAWHRGSSGQRPWVRLLHSLVHCHLARLCEDLFSAAIRDRERSSRG